jgi:general secretion pathway protein L
MTILQIYLPESGLTSDDDAPLRYAMRANNGELQRSGTGQMAELPRADRVDIIVPASMVLFTEVKLPPVRGQKLRQMLPFAVEEKILSDPDQVQVAVGERDEGGITRVAVVDRGWLDACCERLRLAGLRPVNGYAETCLPELEPNAWTLIWDGREGFVRTAVGAGLALDSMGDAGAPFALQRAVEEARNNTKLPEKIILRATDAAASVPDLQLWSTQLGVTVVPGQDWHWAPRFLNAANAINLLQGDYSPSSSLRELIPQLRPILLLAGLIIGAQVLATGVDWWRLNREKKMLTTEMTKTFKAAFPNASVVVDAPLQMQRNLSELRRASGQSQPSDFLPLLAKLLPLMSSATGVEAISYDQGTLKVDAMFRDENSVSDLRNRIASVPNTKVEASNPKDGGVSARIAITGSAR